MWHEYVQVMWIYLISHRHISCFHLDRSGSDLIGRFVQVYFLWRALENVSDLISRNNRKCLSIKCTMWSIQWKNDWQETQSSSWSKCVVLTLQPSWHCLCRQWISSMIFSKLEPIDEWCQTRSVVDNEFVALMSKSHPDECDITVWTPITWNKLPVGIRNAWHNLREKMLAYIMSRSHWWTMPWG